MLSVALARGIKKALNITGREGSTLPGKVSIKIFDKSLTEASKFCDKIILVSGTNGKTTMTNIISKVLSEDNSVLTNNSGANLLSGVSTTFLVNQGIKEKKYYDYAVIEVDESSLGEIAKRLNPDYIILNNLTMDQIDRHKDVVSLSKKINSELHSIDSVVIVNSNDPHAVFATDRLSQKRLRTLIKKNTGSKEMNLNCIDCGRNKLLATNIELILDEGSGGLKSDYFCNGCKYSSYKDIVKYDVDWNKGERISFNLKGFEIETGLIGDFHKENIKLMLYLFKELEVGINSIKKGMEKKLNIPGRGEIFRAKNNEMVLNLVKNPASFNLIIDSYKRKNVNSVYLFFGNDIADGKSEDWIEHLDLVSLKAFPGLKYIFVSGTLSRKLEKELNDLNHNRVGSYISVGYIDIEEIKRHTQNNKDRSELTRNLIITNYSMLNRTRKIVKGLEEIE